jgi:hypothetical protein
MSAVAEEWECRWARDGLNEEAIFNHWRLRDGHRTFLVLVYLAHVTEQSDIIR